MEIINTPEIGIQKLFIGTNPDVKFKIKKHLDEKGNILYGVAKYSKSIFFCRDSQGNRVFYRKSGFYFDLPNTTFIRDEEAAFKLAEKLLECENYNE